MPGSLDRAPRTTYGALHQGLKARPAAIAGPVLSGAAHAVVRKVGK